MTHPAILLGSTDRLPLPAPAPSRSLDAGHDPIAEAARISAFSRLWAQVLPTVRAYLASFIPDAPALDDCLQEIALVAWRKGPLDDGESVFLGHCLACARRIGLASLRKKRHDRLLLLAPDVAQTLADTVALRERATSHTPVDRIDALRHCLAHLKSEQRSLIELRYSKDGSNSLSREAARLGKSPDTLYKRLERLRSLLRQCVTRRVESAD